MDGRVEGEEEVKTAVILRNPRINGLRSVGGGFGFVTHYFVL